MISFANFPSLVISSSPLVLISNLPMDIHFPDFGLGKFSNMVLFDEACEHSSPTGLLYINSSEEVLSEIFITLPSI